jgi:hypothetical protein
MVGVGEDGVPVGHGRSETGADAFGAAASTAAPLDPLHPARTTVAAVVSASTAA